MSESNTLGVGTVLAGRYRLESPIGEGSTGTIYQATQLGIERTVALKLMRPELLVEQDLVERFQREAMVVSQLSHPNIVRLIDYGVDPASGLPFLVLEHVRGETLRLRLQSRGPLSELEAASLLAQAARALLAAHEIGLVHRDLKPDNLMVERLPGGDELLRVLDFGVVKIFGEQALTAAGAKVGTPRYMSPEQIRGEAVDGRSDLYGLGCVLHELLTGQGPYPAASMVEMLAAHIRAPIPPLPAVLVDGRRPTPALAVLHASLLAKRPEGRPAGAEAVMRAFDALAGRGAGGALTPVTALASPSPLPISGASPLSTPATSWPDPSEASATIPARARRTWSTAVLTCALLGVAGALLWAALTLQSGVESAPLSPAPEVVRSTQPQQVRPLIVPAESAAAAPEPERAPPVPEAREATPPAERKPKRVKKKIAIW